MGRSITKSFDKVLVDGDLLVHSVASATQKNIYFIYVEGCLAHVGSDKRWINEQFKGIDYSFERYVNTQPLLAAIQTYKTILKGYAKRFKTNKVEVYLTGSTNFRDEIAVTKPYKGNRSGEKPNNFAKLKEYAIKHGAVVSDGEEADDVLSYLSYNNYDVVNVTIDKDALNTPSYIYNNKKEELIYVSEEDANKAFWTQTLVGDTCDNITGIHGCGKATAEAVLEGLQTYKELECAVGMLYACHPKIDDPEAYLLEQGRLLWMRRSPEEMWRLNYD